MKKHQISEFERTLIVYNIPRPTCYSGVGPGWLPVVSEMFQKMIAAGWDRQLEQIKEKFCQLRVYTSQSQYEMKDGLWVKEGEFIKLNKLGEIIDEAVGKCDELCEDCGKERELKGCRSGAAWCNACLKDFNNYNL